MDIPIETIFLLAIPQLQFAQNCKLSIFTLIKESPMPIVAKKMKFPTITC